MKILPVFIPHLGCPFKCVYCDQRMISGIGDIDDDKILTDIKNFCDQNKDLKKQIAFYGGTFTNMKPDQIRFYLNMTSPFLDDKTGLRFSTRPDCVDQEILDLCLHNSVRTIELGIQSFSDAVLSKCRRGYDSRTAIEACLRVRKSGFELGVQLMPGLPGEDIDALNETISKTLKIGPDFVRIYPTLILRNTVLETWYKEGKYLPLTLEKAVHISAQMVDRFTADGIRVIKIGLHSDLNVDDIAAGPYHKNFGELVKARILENKILKEFNPSQILVISNKDLSLFTGNKRKLIRDLKDKLKIKELRIGQDQELSSGEIMFRTSDNFKVW